jgi:hypothetical protein
VQSSARSIAAGGLVTFCLDTKSNQKNQDKKKLQPALPVLNAFLAASHFVLRIMRKAKPAFPPYAPARFFVGPLRAFLFVVV